jgi:phenylalanyl-tRNA synthetase beta chain
MKLSLDWLRQFTDAPGDPGELKSALTGLGLGVELFTTVGDDVVFEIEVTTNRPDCLSHFGVAREIATLYRLPLRRPEFRLQESEGPAASSEIAIEIADPDLCPRYCGRVIRNLQVRPSPPWLARRLEAVGVRSINNVADVTNYALMELGQPLHAFDLDRLRDRRIIVRRARVGEYLRTLDGVDRKLAPDNLVIADGQLPAALAGIMGGAESEISAATRSVLLESAWFDPVSVRRTSKSHGMHTEASHHFERGADIDMAPFAADRAAAMIAEIAGGQVLQGLIDVYPRPYLARESALRSSEIRRILGMEMPAEEVERILGSLGFQVQQRSAGSWHLRVPSWRLDVSREVDFIEEVARVYGYDRLPARIRAAPPRPERDARREKELTLSGTLISLGYREIIASSMVDPAEGASFTGRQPVRLLNPLSQEAAAMRSTPVPGMLRALRWNLDRGQTDLRLFEMGKTYAEKNSPQSLPDEHRILALGLTGCRRPASVHDRESPLGFFDLKGDLESLLGCFDVSSLRFEALGPPYLEAGLAGRFVAGKKPLAAFGQLNHAVARGYKLRQPAWLAEVDLDLLLQRPLKSVRLVAYSRFPSVERDFSLVVPEGVTYADLREAVEGRTENLVQRVWPVDLFRGGSIPAGCYSLLLRMTFCSPSHTLTSAEVDEASREILHALESKGVRLRG